MCVFPYHISPNNHKQYHQYDDKHTNKYNSNDCYSWCNCRAHSTHHYLYIIIIISIASVSLTACILINNCTTINSPVGHGELVNIVKPAVEDDTNNNVDVVDVNIDDVSG